MKKRYRVILADDHPVVRRGIKQELSAFDVVAECNNATELYQALEKIQADVVVTDYAMPGGRNRDGTAMLERLRRHYPHVKIIVLTCMKLPCLLAQMDALQVDGILSKDAETCEIPLAIMRAMAGSRYYGATVKEALAEADMAHRSKASTLSTREIEVLRLFLSGLGMTQIAQKSCRSIKTVSNQKQSALRKLGCANDVELFKLKAMDGLDGVLQSNCSDQAELPSMPSNEH